MTVSTAMCTSFKQESWEGLHNMAAAGGDSFKIALYLDAAVIDATTTVYSATNEASGTGYTAGGATLTNIGVATSGTTAYADFSNPSWPASTIASVTGCLIYNSTNANRAVSSHAFGSTVSSSSGTFSITMPTADSSNAVLRFA